MGRGGGLLVELHSDARKYVHGLAAVDRLLKGNESESCHATCGARRMQMPRLKQFSSTKRNTSQAFSLVRYGCPNTFQYTCPKFIQLLASEGQC